MDVLAIPQRRAHQGTGPLRQLARLQISQRTSLTKAKRTRAEPQTHPWSSTKRRDPAIAFATIPAPIPSTARSRLASARSVDQRTRTEPGQNINQQNLPAIRFDDFMTDDLLARVIAAFYQYARLDFRNELYRSVLLEDHDKVDGFQRSQNFRTSTVVLNRTPIALQSLHRCVAIQADNEAVAGGARRGQDLDVTRMEDVETTVREPQPEALPAPIHQNRVESSAAGYDFLFRGQECMWKDFSPQFS